MAELRALAHAAPWELHGTCPRPLVLTVCAPHKPPEHVFTHKSAHTHTTCGMQLPSPGPVQGPGLPSSITSCTFDSLNYGVVVQNWAGVVFVDNVVARSWRTAFDVDALSTGLQFIRNMVRERRGL